MGSESNVTNFKVGDKLIYGDGGWYEEGTIVTVLDVDSEDTHMPYYVTDGEDELWIEPDNLTLKPTKNQRITALESEVATLKAEVEALKKAQQVTVAPTITVKSDADIPSIAAKLADQLERATEKRQSQTPNQQASANSLRKAIIAEAKAFVAKYTTPNSRYDDTSVVVRNTRCTYDFYVNEKKRVVTVLFRSVTRRSVIVKAIAKCAPDDVFNTDIGKAIALGRALGLNVERFEQAVKPTEVVVGHVVTTKDIAGVSHTQQVTHFERHYNTKCAMFADGRGVSTEKFTDSASLPIIVDDTEAKY